MKRRDFIATGSIFVAGSMLASPMVGLSENLILGKKTKLAMVGTGVRGTNMWGKSVVEEYSDHVEFVGLCDINPGRVEYAKKYLNVSCPTYTDFTKMMTETKPDILIVTTKDSIHHEYIIKGMEFGANIITEKPMTTDETKCQQILDAEKKTGKKVTVTFNYRYSPHRARIYELLREGAIGKVTSADFHWYLDTRHGADYFRRWHRLKEEGGTLLVHKSTHHFDLMNWWLESEPSEVVAFGQLDFYGKNNSFRSTNCRPCVHKEKCKFYWDMTKNQELMDLYAANEKHDGYLRDGCVWKEDINIYDKMAVMVKYANNVQLSYSLTTYSPYEGYRIAFQGTEGRIDAWIKESFREGISEKYDEIMITKNFGDVEYIHVPHGGGGHGGGDSKLKDFIFKNQTVDPLRQSAGVRDGAMSILTGIAARKSIETGKSIKVADLTELKPLAKKI